MRVLDVVLADDDLRLDARLVDVAEHFNDLADGTTCGRRPPRDLHHHHVVRFGRQRPSGRHVDIRFDAAIERNDVGKTARICFEAADDRVLRALDDANDAPFETFGGFALDADRDAVTVHRFGPTCGGDVY